MPEPVKPKLCKVCKEPFAPWATTQRVCSQRCALLAVKAKQAKAYAKETSRLRREHRASDRAYQLKLAQTAFNAYIRERDKDLPCISSGRTTGQMHAGHYKSVGAYPELRFCEQNCNKQSMKDNAWLSGNVVGYRQGLIDKYSEGVVLWLEGPHEPKKYTIDEIIEIKERYKVKLKALSEK